MPNAADVKRKDAQKYLVPRAFFGSGRFAGGGRLSIYREAGKQAAPGMVAMSSHYPFGTKLSINGVVYTVEDRGGSGIESNIARVDIFEADHQTALRKGRYYAIATFYK